MVSKLNPAQRSVTVEWYERGETKGKEVELDMLLALNPELIQNKQSYVAPPPSATAPVNLQRVSRFGFVRPKNDALLAMRHHKTVPCQWINVQLYGKFDTIKASIQRACLHGFHRIHRHGLFC